MPLVGYGIWKVPRENAAESVYNAIKLGYRHIDGAYDYTNSREAGQGVQRAIAEGIIKREDIFVTSKLWNNYHKKQHVQEMGQFEVDAWGIGYLDLYLIHFPISLKYIAHSELSWPCFWTDKEQTKPTPLDPTPLSETWAAMESLVDQGLVKSIGVANFNAQLLYDLLSYARIPPAVNQVEHHPYLVQPNLIKMCQESGITVTAYSSFGPQSFIELNNADALKVEPLFAQASVARVAGKHGKTPAQVLLRWATQRGIVVIPKSNSVDRLKQNLESTDFDLAPEEIDEIASLDKRLRFNQPSDISPQYRIFD